MAERPVERFVERLLADAPIVQRLSGTLSQDVSVEDYREYLERKHGRDV
jgi:hypothetical protein